MRRSLPLLLAAVVAAFLMTWFAGWSGDGATRPEAWWILLTSLPWVLLWFAGAAGFGVVLGAWLAPGVEPRGPVWLTLGVAVMLWLDTVLGRLGLLQAAGGVTAWAVCIAGASLLVVAIARRGERQATETTGLSWIVLAASPAVAVLIAASVSTPGWLWTSEFGGYDALSYHLQLPREWHETAGIRGLEHNVYSFLPGYVEAAYYHLAVLQRESLSAVCSAQLLHAGFAAIAAWTVGGIAFRLAGSLARTAGIVLLLGTPWVIVTGSLAYNELVVAQLLGAAILVLMSRATSDGDAITSRGLRDAATIGVLAAAACGAKLTAAGFVTLPVVVLLLWHLPVRRWPATLLTCAGAGLVVLLPWLLGNALATGNPVFPFMTNLLGTGHWTSEQARIWHDAHLTTLTLGDRLTEAWQQLGRFGLGGSPYPENEPWLPQWSWLPWFGLAGLLSGLGLGMTRSASAFRRRWCVGLLVCFGLQLLFWLTLTHVKSRFMLPAVLPLAAGAAVGLAWIAEWRWLAARPRLAMLIVSVPLVGYGLQPVLLYRGEQGGRPAAWIGLNDVRTGHGLPDSERSQWSHVWPEVYVNYVLPTNARVLLVGEATPLFYDADVVYCTTWDRGPLSTVIDEHPDDDESWIPALQNAGYTHLVVNPVMLEIWERSGWNDPRITPGSIITAAERDAHLVREYPDGRRIYRLE